MDSGTVNSNRIDKLEAKIKKLTELLLYVVGSFYSMSQEDLDMIEKEIKEAMK